MNCRERVNRAIRFAGPDRVPVMHAVLPAAWYRHGAALHKILSQYPRDLAAMGGGDRAGGGATGGYTGTLDLAERYPVDDDFGYVECRSFQLGPPGKPGTSRDEWGCVWEKIDPGIVGQVIEHPLADWDRLATYRFPDPLAYWRWDLPALQQRVAKARTLDKYVVAYAGNLFELMQWLRGHSDLLMDIATPSEVSRVRALAERVTEYNLKTVETWLGFDVDAIAFNDDWGTQRQLMIRPEQWRDILRPCYKVLFDRVHAAGRHVHFHSDGNVLEILPDLVEMGVEVVNLQVSVLDLEAVAMVIGGRICLRTDVDRQYILTRADPGEVTAYVKRLTEVFGGARGGIIACGEINSDSRLENVAAMYEAFDRFGRYL